MEDEIKRAIINYKEYEKSTIQKMDALYEKRRALIKQALKIEDKISSLNKELKNEKERFKRTIKERNNKNRGIHPIKIKFKQEAWCSLGGYYLLVDKLKEVKEF